MLCAARGTGKTLFAMYLADAISKGQDFCCWPNQSGPQKVLYFDGEVFYKEFQLRLQQMEPNENLYQYCRTYADNLRQKPLLRTDKDSRDEIKNFIIKNEIKFVVFDNLVSLTPGIEENSSKEYGDINQFFLTLRSLGVSVMFLHHTGKGGKQRGTSGREDNVDTIIQLIDRKEGAAEAKFELYFEKFRGMVTHATKQLVRKRELKCVQDDNNKWIWLFGEVDLTRDPDFIARLIAGFSIRRMSEIFEVSKYKIESVINYLKHREIIDITGSTRTTKYEITEKGQEYYAEEFSAIELKILEYSAELNSQS
jgi:putative DNA primase/helicase